MGASDNIDAYAPRAIAKPVEAAGIAKPICRHSKLYARTSRRCVHRIWRDALYRRRHQQRVGAWSERLLGGVAARLNLHTGRRAELLRGQLIDFAWVDKKFPPKTPCGTGASIMTGTCWARLPPFQSRHLFPHRLPSPIHKRREEGMRGFALVRLATPCSRINVCNLHNCRQISLFLPM